MSGNIILRDSGGTSTSLPVDGSIVTSMDQPTLGRAVSFELVNVPSATVITLYSSPAADAGQPYVQLRATQTSTTTSSLDIRHLATFNEGSFIARTLMLRRRTGDVAEVGAVGSTLP